MWCHLTKLLSYLTRVPISLFPFFSIKLVTRHESILFWTDRSHLLVAWTFQFDLHIHSKILANLTVNRKIHSPTKPDNKIINTINHHDNWVILLRLERFIYRSVNSFPLPRLSFLLGLAVTYSCLAICKLFFYKSMLLYIHHTFFSKFFMVCTS